MLMKNGGKNKSIAFIILFSVTMPPKFWYSVLWIDETKLQIFSPMDKLYVWRKKNEA